MENFLKRQLNAQKMKADKEEREKSVGYSRNFPQKNNKGMTIPVTPKITETKVKEDN